MKAKDILEIIDECECCSTEDRNQLTRVAFQIAAKQKEIDSKLAADMGSIAISDAIMSEE